MVKPNQTKLQVQHSWGLKTKFVVPQITRNPLGIQLIGPLKANWQQRSLRASVYVLLLAQLRCSDYRKCLHPGGDETSSMAASHNQLDLLSRYHFDTIAGISIDTLDCSL